MQKITSSIEFLIKGLLKRKKFLRLIVYTNILYAIFCRGVEQQENDLKNFNFQERIAIMRYIVRVNIPEEWFKLCKCFTRNARGRKKILTNEIPQ